LIGRLSGTILEKHPPMVLVDVQGVAYEVDVPMSTFYQLPATGGKVTLHTQLVVREDAHLLYGFATDGERQAFRQLLKISGIGARTALSVLSGLTVEELHHAVANQDSARLVRIPGIGRKTAERLLLELRDKLETIAEGRVAGGGEAFGGDALNALLALGYSVKEAKAALARLDPGLPAPDAIRQALKGIQLTKTSAVQRLAAVVCTCALLSAARAANDAAPANDYQAEQEQNKKDAVERVVDSHDFTLVLGVGRFYLKQSAIKSARRLLGQWGREADLGPGWSLEAVQWQRAEAVLLRHAAALQARRFDHSAWIGQTWSEYVSRRFDGEEADVIATHFQTEGGRLQRQLLDWYMGETMLFNYSFTDRLDSTLRGSEPELLELQRATQPRIPVEDIYFAGKYPEAFNFVAKGTGLEYAKMLAIPLAGALIRHIDDLAHDVDTDLAGRRSEVQPFLDAYKAAP
jgi:holliday junction DNA helicase RuvA